MNLNETNSSDFSAVRSWNPTRTKATIMVTYPGKNGPITKKVGGNRAMRASIAFVVFREDSVFNGVNGPYTREAYWKFLGLRADPSAQLSKRERDYYHQVVVVPVTEVES